MLVLMVDTLRLLTCKHLCGHRQDIQVLQEGIMKCDSLIFCGQEDNEKSRDMLWLTLVQDIWKVQLRN